MKGYHLQISKISRFQGPTTCSALLEAWDTYLRRNLIGILSSGWVTEEHFAVVTFLGVMTMTCCWLFIIGELCIWIEGVKLVGSSFSNYKRFTSYEYYSSNDLVSQFVEIVIERLPWSGTVMSLLGTSRGYYARLTFCTRNGRRRHRSSQIVFGWRRNCSPENALRFPSVLVTIRCQRLKEKWVKNVAILWLRCNQSDRLC